MRSVLVLFFLALFCAHIRAQGFLNNGPISLPGKIDFENFDLGGEGVAYHDNEPENLGGAYRLAEGVDIGDCFDVGQGYSIGWTRAGEWIQYTVSIAVSAVYDIEVRYASLSCGGAFHFELDGVAVTQPVSVSTTGSWQVWRSLILSAPLNATDSAKLRIIMDANGPAGSVANLNYVTFSVPAAATTPPVAPTAAPDTPAPTQATSAPTAAPTPAPTTPAPTTAKPTTAPPTPTPTSAPSPYALQREYAGSSFFDRFNFFTAADPTHGYVTYVDKNTATNAGLAKITPNGQVFMGVDNTSIAWGAGRRSVRIESTDTYNSGLFVLDLEHMPTGCGTWPAFWLVGPNWPSGGEVDIFEGVHNQAATVSVLHTSNGCSMYNADPNLITGSWIVRNCYVYAPGQAANQGCGVTGKVGSFGAPLNAAKGGVSATQWDSTGIKIWFWQRGSVPADLTSGAPLPASWGKPYARFDFGAECPSSHFSNQFIVFNTALCGDWAGGTFGSACPNMGSCQSFVQTNPSAFTQAYWLVNSLRVYQLK